MASSTSIIRVGAGAEHLRLGAFHLQPTRLVVRGKPSRAEWERCGEVLHRIEGAVQWWLGDWLNYGEKAYGEKYAEALDATGFEQHTLENYAYVAGNIKTSLRREDVSYSIHKEIAPLPVDQQKHILARAADEQLTVSAVRDLVRQESHLSKVAAIARGSLPAGEYDVICADPPWQYDNAGFNQSAAAHYPTQPTAVIEELPTTDSTFPKFADPCVLFLWATSPLLPSAIDVLEAWGFAYKACLIWVKDRAPGLGWWLDTRHELLLIGVRGSTTPIEKVDSVITAMVDTHSRKPVEAYAAIERMFPGLRRVECFARAPRPGWSVWGNEV